MKGDRSLLIRTALSKSSRQLCGIVDRKIRNRLVPRLPIDFDERYERQIPEYVSFDADPLWDDLDYLRGALSEAERKSYRRRSNAFARGTVTFLNRSRKLDDPGVIQSDDNRIDGLPRLWYLKLAGLEPLEWLILGFNDPESVDGLVDSFDAWIRQFHAEHEIGTEIGYLRGAWTPYAVSHRIINLARYAAWMGGLPKSIQRFLFKNLLFLKTHIEEDVGGNHLIENGTALVIGGAAFPQHGNRFIDRGVDVLQQAATEQFLDDGYHYERSPMYHLAVTKRLLSVCAVLETMDKDVPETLRERTANAQAFIKYLITPDGTIPLLNDTVYSETLEATSCIRYGNQIGFSKRVTPTLEASGLVWIDSGNITVLADYGASGPDNLLAHTHNDPFAICVWVNDTRVITDTGTYDYQPGTKRQRSRSVRAHNTAHPEGKEPVTFDGRFLMADRLEPSVSMERGASNIVYGVYSAPKSNYDHRRWLVEGDNWVFIWDSIDHEHDLFSRLHSAPGIEIQRDPQPRFVIDDDVILQVRPIQVERVLVESTPYFPEFGVETQRESLVFRSSDVQGFGYLLSEGIDTSVSVAASNSNLEAVTVDDDRIEIPEVES